MRELPSLECSLWWATAGTMCVVVCAATAEDAEILVRDRFAAAGRRWAGKCSLATSAQWAQYQDAIARIVELDCDRRLIDVPSADQGALL